MRKVIELLFIWISIIIIIVLAINEKKLTSRQKKLYLLIFIIFSSFLLGNNSVLVDTPLYLEKYASLGTTQIMNYLTNNPFENEFEWIYLLMVYFAKNLGMSFGMFLSFYIMIPQLLLYYGFLNGKKNKLKIFSLYYVYFCFFPMGYRQMFSDSFYLMTFLSSNFIICLICYIISIFSHFSNLLVTLFPIIKNNIILRLNIIQLLVIVIVFSFSIRQILISFINILPNDNSIVFKLQYYMMYNTDIYSYQNSFHYLLHFIVNNYLPVAFIIFIIKYRNKMKVNNLIAYKSVLLSICIYIFVFIVLNSYTTASRIFLTFFIPIVLFVDKANLIKKMYILLITNNFFITLYIIFTYIGWNL